MAEVRPKGLERFRRQSALRLVFVGPEQAWQFMEQAQLQCPGCRHMELEDLAGLVRLRCAPARTPDEGFRLIIQSRTGSCPGFWAVGEGGAIEWPDEIEV